MYLPLLVKLSENEKKALIVIFFVVIIVFYLLGFIYESLNKFMARQGRDIGRLMANQIESGYITSLRQFKKNSYRKSRIEFYKSFGKSFIAVIVWFAIYGTVSLFYRHWLNMFDQVEEGFTTLFYTFDFANTPTTKMFGLTVINNWPPVLHHATFSVKAIPSYVLFLFAIILIIILFVQIMSYLARTIFIMQHGKKMFERDITEYRLHDLSAAPADLQEKGINVPEVVRKEAPVESK